MQPPFTTDEFMAVLRAYNVEFWPAQVLLAIGAVAVLAFSFRGDGRSDRVAAGLLGAMWIWCGVAYHLIHFTEINSAAWLFGGLFIVEGVLLVALGVLKHGIRFRPRLDAAGLLGGGLIAYALVLYPLLGSALGHTYPHQPTFGLPCPLTIFTFGMLVWTEAGSALSVAWIPFAWSLVGTNAAVLFGISEDLGLGAAGLVGVSYLVARRIRRNRSEAATQLP